ncbi:hypothetical protein ACNUDN_00420 [Mycobacterium sp. smrl_JER01]|uniref:hypothetical protein n=1 Tax=Mycobacterium sp. smrl_JER01 TaxID=3402633 RepID=UPI003AD770B7
MPATNELLLTDELSSYGQKQASRERVTEDAFTGLVRLNIAIFGKLLIPDSDLFNGSVLLELSPKKLLEMAGHTAERPTLVIRTRARSMPETLRLTLTDVNQKRFHPLSLRLLVDDQLESSIALALAQTHLPKKQDLTRTMRRLFRVAREMGATEDQIGRIESGWNVWSKFDDESVLRTWPSVPFNLAREMTANPLSTEQFATDAGRRAYQQVVRDTVQHNQTRYGALTAALNDHTPASNDAELLRAWYHDRRQLALKHQHGSMLSVRPSNYLAFMRATFGTDSGSYPDGVPVEEVALDPNDARGLGSVAYKLANLDPDEFRNLYQKTSTNRIDWLHKHKVSSLRRLVEQIGESLSGADAPKGWANRSMEILQQSTAPIAGGGVGSGVGAALSEVVPDISAAPGGVAGVVLVGGAVAARKVGINEGWLSSSADHRSVVRWARETRRVT